MGTARVGHASAWAPPPPPARSVLPGRVHQPQACLPAAWRPARPHSGAAFVVSVGSWGPSSLAEG